MAIDTSERLSKLDLKRIKDFARASLQSYQNISSTPSKNNNNNNNNNNKNNVEIILLTFGNSPIDINNKKALTKTLDGESTSKPSDFFDKITYKHIPTDVRMPMVKEILYRVNKKTFGDLPTTSTAQERRKNLLIMTVFGRIQPAVARQSPEIVADLDKKGVKIVVLAIDNDEPELLKSIFPPSNIIPVDGSRELPDAIGLLEGKTRQILGEVSFSCTNIELSRIYYSGILLLFFYY